MAHEEGRMRRPGMPLLPQPGERWRIRIRPVEYDCPACGTPLHVGANADDGRIVRIIDPKYVPGGADSFVHRRDGCNASIPLPEGWIWYTDEGWFYVLPYTLFEPVETTSD